MCDIWFCISWPAKSQHASSNIDRLASRCSTSCVVPLYLLASKITTCIIAHRPIRFASRCAISGVVSLGQQNHNMHHRTSTESIRESMYDIWRCIFVSLGQQNHNMHHRTSTDSIRQSTCDIWGCISWPAKSQHASSHIDRFDSPVDVRYLGLYLFLASNITTCIIAHRVGCHRPIRFASRCAISGVVSLLGQQNHNMHHRTSTDSIRQSMCDIWCCISSWPAKSQHASSHIDRFD